MNQNEGRLSKAVDANRAGYGLRSRDDIRSDIVRRMVGYITDGTDPDEALTKASADVRNDIETEWAGKTAEVLRFLGIKAN